MLETISYGDTATVYSIKVKEKISENIFLDRKCEKAGQQMEVEVAG